MIIYDKNKITDVKPFNNNSKKIVTYRGFDGYDYSTLQEARLANIIHAIEN